MFTVEANTVLVVKLQSVHFLGTFLCHPLNSNAFVTGYGKNQAEGSLQV